MNSAKSMPLISYEDALRTVLFWVKTMPKLKVSLKDSLGHALCENIKAPSDLPTFNSSAVDGYAVRISDMQAASPRNPIALRVQTVISAGDGDVPALKEECAIKLFTGAQIPKGAEAVVMREYAQEKNGMVIISASAYKGENIRYAGEEFKKGEIVLKAGTDINPAVVGFLASLGIVKVPVRAKPKVSIITSGDEVVSYEMKLKEGQIRDANLPMISSTLKALGINVIYARHSRDDMQSLKKILAKALDCSDVLIAIGGVSVGDYDYVKSALSELGVREIFWRVNIKPGKPIFFGARGRKLVFGLPGNPVSAMVCFQLFVIPAIKKMIGSKEVGTFTLSAELDSEVKKKEGRTELLRGRFSIAKDGRIIVSPIRSQGSHMLGGLANSNCLILLDETTANLSKGASVRIIPLLWRELI